MNSILEEKIDSSLMKFIVYNSLRFDITKLNIKAKIITSILTSRGFVEVGTGTNRIAFINDGLLYKIAIDRRGVVDNITEFKRAEELPDLLAMTYESNGFVNVCEYVTVMSHDMFISNQGLIKDILADLSEVYLFNDIGYTTRNTYNWGFRTTEDGDELPVVLDYGYMYPLMGQNLDDLLACRSCGNKLSWNSGYTQFRCQNPSCGLVRTPSQIEELMDKSIENIENQIVGDIPDGVELHKFINSILKQI